MKLQVLFRLGCRRLVFFVLQCLARVGRRGGFGRLRRIGNALGDMHYALAFRKRAQLKRQMTRALGIHEPDLSSRILRSAYRSGDRAVLEIIAMCKQPLPDAQTQSWLRVDGLDLLRSELAPGRGLILIGMHMGNGIALAAWLVRQGFEVSLVYRQSRKMPEGALTHCIEQHGIEGICARKRERAYRGMHRALQRGRIVFVMMDQDTRHGGIPVRFLGKDIELAGGPSLLALRTGAPMLTAFAVADQPGWHFRFGPALKADGGSLHQSAAAISQAMENHIRAYPQLWTWHHRRWRRYPFATESARDSSQLPSTISASGGSRATASAGNPTASPAKEASSTRSW